MVEVSKTLRLIEWNEALRLRMKLDSWNMFVFVEHEDEYYMIEFDPTFSSDIDEDVNQLHEDWDWRIREFHGEEEE